MNFNEKDSKKRHKRETAPKRISKFGRSVTTDPAARSTFATEIVSVNPPTVTSIDANEAGEVMRIAETYQ